MTPTIAIIGALEKEVRQIYAEVDHGTVAEEAGLKVVGGEYHGFNLVATVAGMGTVNAAAAAQHLVSRYGANALIFSGIAGGLNPALHIGDVVIGETLRYIDTDTALIAAANDDRLQEPYRRPLIPDYDDIRTTCLTGGAKTLWISGSGSTLMAVTDDTIVAKFLQVRLREQFPACETHILTCDTEGAQIEYL